MSPLGSATTEGVNGPGASDRFTAMPESLWYEIFLSGFDGDAFVINDEGVAALYHDHVFVVIMHMRCGNSGLVASPECHLTPICSVKDVTLDAGVA